MIKWIDGVTLDGGSEIASNHLLGQKEMADGGVDVLRYNRQGRAIHYEEVRTDVLGSNHMSEIQQNVNPRGLASFHYLQPSA